MREVTRYRYYSRNDLCTNLRGAQGQLSEASRQARKLPNTKRLARTIDRLAGNTQEVLDKAMALAILPEEKAAAQLKKRAVKLRKERR